MHVHTDVYNFTLEMTQPRELENGGRGENHDGWMQAAAASLEKGIQDYDTARVYDAGVTFLPASRLRISLLFHFGVLTFIGSWIRKL